MEQYALLIEIILCYIIYFSAYFSVKYMFNQRIISSLSVKPHSFRHIATVNILFGLLSEIAFHKCLLMRHFYIDSL